MSSDEDYSFENISQIRQKERRKQLSKLHLDFYERFTHRLDKLKTLYQEENNKDQASLRSMMYADEIRKTKLIFEEIRTRRLRKIALAALRSATKEPEPPQNLLPTEHELFDDMVAVLKRNKRALDAIMGVAGDGDDASMDLELKTEDLIVMEPASEVGEVRSPEEAEEREEPQTLTPGGEEDLALIRVLGDTDSFLGTDQRSYNLRKEDILEIPMSIANLLIKNKKAELFSA